MRKLILGLSAIVLICIAGYVTAQTTAPDRKSTETTTTTTETTTTTPSQADRDAQLRLAAMDTSPAAFRRLDTDHDGRISALEAADNPRVAAAFTMADKDKDGYLSKEEFEAMGSAGARSRDVDASSPSGDRASEPGGDQPATAPNDPSSTSPSPKATPRSKR